MEIKKQDLVYCGVCRKQCSKTLQKVSGRDNIFVDEHGRRWYGRRCPDCYKAYKTAYDAKRRLQHGHVPIGNSVPCSSGCGNTVTIGNGTHRTCEACRAKHE